MPMQFISRRASLPALASLLLVLGGCSSVPFISTGPTKSEVVPAGDELARNEIESVSKISSENSARTPAGVAPPAVSGTPTPPVKPANADAFATAVALIRGEQWQSARKVLLTITASQPELAGPWVNLGLVHARLGDQDAADEAWTMALAANPKNCVVLNHMGVAARRAGRFEQAEKYYQQCLEHAPEFSPARLNLGILYELYMGRYVDALAAYQDYQLALAEPDNKVNGWMLDLERRVAALAQR